MPSVEKKRQWPGMATPQKRRERLFPIVWGSLFTMGGESQGSGMGNGGGQFHSLTGLVASQVCIYGLCALVLSSENGDTVMPACGVIFLCC